jgi:small subunit ribosomal protein S20
MAHSASAKKRIRQNEQARARNRWRKRAMRDSIKDLLDKVAHGGIDESQEALKKACAVIDRTAQKGVIHKNTAARYKSRLNTRVKAKKAAA